LGFGDSFSSVSAQAEDAHISSILEHRVYWKDLANMIGLQQIVIKLPDNLGNINALWVNINYRGAVVQSFHSLKSSGN